MNNALNQHLSALFPRASQSFRAANPQLFAREPEQDLRPAVVHPAPGKTEGHARPLVRIIMHRVRLLDKENAYGATKALTDCLCKVGLLPGDAENQIDLQVTQEKVPHRVEQRTEVTITYGQGTSETFP